MTTAHATENVSAPTTLAPKKILIEGMYSNNVIFVQMFGMCPTMALTTNATNGLGMGLMTTMVLMCSNLIISLMRHITPNQVRIPIYILIIASLVTILDFSMNAWLHNLHKVMGLFIALIVANCAVLGRGEAFAGHNPPLASLLDGLAIGLGFTGGLTLIGMIREVLGSGTLFNGAATLLGSHFEFMEMHVLPPEMNFLVMLLPPGGFLVLGFLLAGMKQIKSVKAAAKQKKSSTIEVVNIS